MTIKKIAAMLFTVLVVGLIVSACVKGYDLPGKIPPDPYPLRTNIIGCSPNQCPSAQFGSYNSPFNKSSLFIFLPNGKLFLKSTIHGGIEFRTDNSKYLRWYDDTGYLHEMLNSEYTVIVTKNSKFEWNPQE